MNDKLQITNKIQKQHSINSDNAKADCINYVLIVSDVLVLSKTKFVHYFQYFYTVVQKFR